MKGKSSDINGKRIDKLEADNKRYRHAGLWMLLAIFLPWLLLGSMCAMACSEDDLEEISLKDYYLCMGQNWCKR